MLHLFAFGDDESLNTSNNKVDQLDGNAATQFNPLLHATVSSDKFMEALLSKHHPKWIANYHEHESLLQENEDEKLSKEEQDMAWEVYRRTLEWEEVQRNPVEGPTPVFKPTNNEVEPEPKPEPKPEPRTKKPPRCTRVCSRDRFVLRKCTNLAHMLTLRSQGVKQGCTTICGECGHEISWNGVK
ncbi:unnamed protein product [Lactuca saligna]|uniref:Uncharacterized protein n=1 Tax=Lactuca saligna TaxID=75948 RepID=A0AA35VFD7_LACSI|nr:unnamed protein product [Lactuca saligna]